MGEASQRLLVGAFRILHRNTTMPDHDTPSLPPPRVAVQRGWGWWRDGFHLFANNR